MSRPRHTGNRGVVLIGLAIVVLLVGSLLLRLGGTGGDPEDRSDEQGRPRETPETVALETEPARADSADETAESVSMRTEDGAVASALMFTAAAQDWLYLPDDAVTSAIEAIATEEAADQLTREALEMIQPAREDLRQATGLIWWVVHPLAWRVEDYMDGEARVSVWTVTVLAAEGVAAPQSEWLTVTTDLHWVEGEWRLDGMWEDRGPTPMTGPDDRAWDAARFDAALDGFQRIGRETD